MAVAAPPVAKFRAKGAIVRLLASADLEVLIDGPANTGKSVGVASILASECETWPMLRCLVVRLTRKSLSESFIQSFENIVMPHGHPVISRRINANNRNSYDWENGSRIVLGSMENAEAFFSTEWDYVVYEELIQGTLDQWLKFHRAMRNRRRPHPDVVYFPEYLLPNRRIDALKLRADFEAGKFEQYGGMMPDRKTPIWKHQIIGVTNPGDENSWIIKRAQSGKMRRFQSTHADNPSFGAQERASLESLEGVLRDRLYLGLWKSAEGAIWPAFSRDVHMLQPPTKPVDGENIALEGAELVQWWRSQGVTRFAVGVDWGNNDPGVMSVYGADEQGRMYRVFEIYHTGWTVGGDSEAPSEEDDWLKAAKRIYTQWRPEVFVCDSARSDCIQLLLRSKLPVVGVSKGVINGKGFVAGRIDLVRERLKVRADGKPRIYWVSDALEARDPNLDVAYKPCCTEEEIPSFAWKRDKTTGRILDGVPADGQADHGCDACTYCTLYFDGFVQYERAVPEATVDAARADVDDPFHFGDLVHVGEKLEDDAIVERDLFSIEWKDRDDDVGKGGRWRLWCDLFYDKRWKADRPEQNRTYVIGCCAGPHSESTMVVTCAETKEQVAEYSAVDLPTEEFARAAARAGMWWGGTAGFAYLIWRADAAYGLAFGEYLTRSLAYPFFYRDRAEDRTDNLRSKKFGWNPSPPKMLAMVERFRACLAGRRGRAGDLWKPRSGRLLDQLEGYAWFRAGRVGPSELEDADPAALLTHSDLVVPAMLSSYGVAHVGRARAELRVAPHGSRAWLEQEKARKAAEDRQKNKWR